MTIAPVEPTLRPQPAPATGVFDRVVCAADGSGNAGVAAAQAGVLVAHGGDLTFVSSSGPASGSRGAATGEVDVAPELLREAEAHGATLVAVGAQGHARFGDRELGGTAAALLHHAPCSVLVARSASGLRFPRTITVGTDGSRHSVAAAAVAQELADRFGARLRVLVAVGGEPVDLDALAHAPRLEWSEESPAAALVAAARSSDLVVVGSRGLHGLRAFGSVGQRVAHEAPCSVLVVRGPLPQPRGGDGWSHA